VGFLGTYGKNGDWLWDSRNITIWTVVECNVGIIAGNLPCMKPLFRTILGSTYGRGSRNRSGSKYMTRSYGMGTGNGGASKNYNSLGSGRIGEDQDYSKKDEDESVLMTRITGKEINRGGRASRTGSPSKDSAESVSWLSTDNQKMGGIKKTTEVKINTSSLDHFDESIKPEQKETRLV